MPYAFNPFAGTFSPVIPGPAGATGPQGPAGFAGPQAVPGSIGVPGQQLFGVGPIVPAGATFYPLFPELYDPVHLPSRSFM
jgi:hypothetical protein